MATLATGLLASFDRTGLSPVGFLQVVSPSFTSGSSTSTLFPARQELTLSFVPDAEQRLWRTVTRKKYQLRCDRVRLQNQLESLLEEAHIKLSSLVSDLFGLSARRMLQAIAEGETNPATLAALADERLRATPEQLCDALGA